MQFLVICRQDDRYNVAYLKIDSLTQSVQEPNERYTHRNQFQNALFSTQKGFLFGRASPMPRRLVRRRLAARSVFSHPSHLIIDVAQILERAQNRCLSVSEHFWACASPSRKGLIR